MRATKATLLKDHFLNYEVFKEIQSKGRPIEAYRLGHPGSFGLYEMTYKLKTDRSRVGSIDRRRKFQIYACLGKQVRMGLPELKGVSSAEGDSFVICFDSKKGNTIQFHTPRGPYFGFGNKRNELSVITRTEKTLTADEAISKFSSGLSFLDHLSFVVDVPLHVNEVVCLDIDNHHVHTYFTAPYMNKPIEKMNIPNTDYLDSSFGLYREAKNSTNFYYSFLCYFKILEGISKKYRKNLTDILRANNLDAKFPREVVPDHPQLKKELPQLVGKPIFEVLEKYLRPESRNVLAHFETEDGVFLRTRDQMTLKKYATQSLLMELSCRVVINTQIELCNRIWEQKHGPLEKAD